MSKKILIIGGVAGGASAAARARRLSETAEITIIEKGSHVSFANCGLPYHISKVIEAKNSLLLQTPQSFKNRFNINVLIDHEAIGIDTIAKKVLVKDLDNKERILTYDKLILSPGAYPIIPPINDIANPFIFTLRNMEDLENIIKHIDCNNVKDAVVCGGGFIGLEMAEALKELDINVSLVELASHLMTVVDPEMGFYVEQEMKANGINLKLNNGLKKVSCDQDKKLDLELNSGEIIKTEMLIMSIGVRPDTRLAKMANIKIGELGGIEVDSNMRTSDPNIYAVGDAIQTINFVSDKFGIVPLAGPANRQGRIAANHIFGIDSEYKKTQGSSICKVFNLTVACTGLNEKMLKKEKIEYEKVYLHAANHATYYPNSSPIHLKLLFSLTGKILGAQAVGKEGVDKRIDLIAVAQRANMSVYDLQDFELCYAPPYNSAKDILNQAGFIASHLLEKRSKIIHADKITGDYFIIDVREASELEKLGSIPNSINMPLNSIRDNLDKIPSDKKIIITCQVGLRGHIACCILQNNGYDVFNLSGGYATWKAYQSASLI